MSAKPPVVEKQCECEVCQALLFMVEQAELGLRAERAKRRMRLVHPQRRRKAA